jgi:hypothetical protein
MTLLTSSTVLGLAWFAAINVAVSTAVWLVVRDLRRRRIEPRAGLWLTLRLLPAAASTLFVLGVFLPAHLRYERPGTPETFGWLVYGLAALSLALGPRTLSRIASAAHATRQLRRWRHVRAVPGISHAIELDGVTVLSLAGIFRTTILLGRNVREALTASELDVALAHETAHQRAFDNVKRFAMYCVPDFFGYTGACRRLEAEWRDCAECLADSRAARGDAKRALNLASALVKVARLSASSPRVLSAPTWTAFYDEPLIETRVRRLVSGASEQVETSSPEPALAAVFMLAACSIMWLAAFPGALHRATEAFARLLP